MVTTQTNSIWRWEMWQKSGRGQFCVLQKQLCSFALTRNPLCSILLSVAYCRFLYHLLTHTSCCWLPGWRSQCLASLRPSGDAEPPEAGAGQLWMPLGALELSRPDLGAQSRGLHLPLVLRAEVQVLLAPASSSPWEQRAGFSADIGWLMPQHIVCWGIQTSTVMEASSAAVSQLCHC